MRRTTAATIPDSDGLLSGGLPGVVDAWYILLDRWGTMSFEQVLQPAIELAENGFPLSEDGAAVIAGVEQDSQVPFDGENLSAERPARRRLARSSGIPIWRAL